MAGRRCRVQCVDLAGDLYEVTISSFLYCAIRRNIAKLEKSLSSSVRNTINTLLEDMYMVMPDFDEPEIVRHTSDAHKTANGEIVPEHEFSIHATRESVVGDRFMLVINN